METGPMMQWDIIPKTKSLSVAHNNQEYDAAVTDPRLRFGTLHLLSPKSFHFHAFFGKMAK